MQILHIIFDKNWPGIIQQHVYSRLTTDGRTIGHPRGSGDVKNRKGNKVALQLYSFTSTYVH